MSFGNTTETDIGAKLFCATAISWDAATILDIHLHTADPDETGTSVTSEADYGDYALVEVARTTAGWTTTGDTTTNDADIVFPIAASGSNAITYVSITPHASTQIIVSGALNGGGVTVSTGIQPVFAAGALTITLN